MCKSKNKNYKDVYFQLGEWVYLKLRPHVQQIVTKRINAKLVACFYGPFMIISKIGAIAYKLKLLENSHVDPIFYVS